MQKELKEGLVSEIKSISEGMQNLPKENNIIVGDNTLARLDYGSL